jgi:GntR family transcriptional regulator, transcriptional repressor for pyruvate dehydrogenase complex
LNDLRSVDLCWTDSTEEFMKSLNTIPIERTTLSAATFERLITNVVHGTWKAGQQIPTERILCQQLGIARNSLREALKAMELIGMLESRVGEGTFVCPRSEFLSRPLLWAFTGTDHAELADLMEARALMEANLAGLAAERATTEELKRIEETIHAMEKHIAGSETVLESDMAFHLYVGQAAHNEVLANAAQLLRNVLKYWIHLKLMVGRIPAQALERHREIYQAIRNRDADASRALMQEHLNETTALITQLTTSMTGSRQSNGKSLRAATKPGTKRQLSRISTGKK